MDKHEALIHRLHLKYKLNKSVIKEIIKSPTRFARKEIESYNWENLEEFKNFRFINLGILHYKPNPNHIAYKKKHKDLED